MSLDRQDAHDEPVGSAAELVEWMRGGEKPRERWRVGTEHEKIGLHVDDLSPVPFAGERGIERVLNEIATRDGWERLREDGRLVALTKDGASITLEPGGQLELSGAPLHSIHDTCREFSHHLELVRAVSEPLGIVWLSLGYQPFIPLERAPQMPKERYRIMRSYLPRRGELALEMMHMTATVQANYDWSDEADMAAKVRMAMGVSAIVSAIFANSSLAEGKASGWISRRLHIWRHVDPDRCGLLPFVFEEDFGYARWVEWALDVPMFFVLRADGYVPMEGQTFRDFLAHGHAGHHATRADFERHLTTLFPEVRIKRILEVRGADAVPPGLICALPALWKGLLYDSDACAAAWALVAGMDFAEREAALDAVARRGLAAELAGRPALEWARELVAIAGEGLRRISDAGVLDPDESGFLAPIEAQLAAGKSPGRVVLERWEGEWGRSPERLIEYARY